MTKMSATEVASLLGVCRKHFVDRISKRHDFPKPCIQVSKMTRFWSKEDVLRWASQPRRY